MHCRYGPFLVKLVPHLVLDIATWFLVLQYLCIWYSQLMSCTRHSGQMLKSPLLQISHVVYLLYANKTKGLIKSVAQVLNIYFLFLMESHLERHFLSVLELIILNVGICLPFHLLQVCRFYIF